MQAGVGWLMQLGRGQETEPKHLRVGVNMAMCESGALAELLIAKGVFTTEEYQDAILRMVEKDVRSYTAKLREILGTDVNLV